MRQRGKLPADFPDPGFKNRYDIADLKHHGGIHDVLRCDAPMNVRRGIRA
jgi:hypothetical protein